MKDIENLINKISQIEICNISQDGRINSISDEVTLITELKKVGPHLGLKMEVPPPRHWCDVFIDGEPFQIKSSSMKSADNWSSKKSILYALTDMTIGEIDKCSNNSQVIQKNLNNRIINNGIFRDLSILIVDKRDGSIHYRKLCELKKLISNGSNLPFQINWRDNLSCQPIKRTPKEAQQFVIGSYLKSIKKKHQQDNPMLLESIIGK